MSPNRPKFDKPPVIETVLSLQFAGLPGYSTAHAGRFWSRYLDRPSGTDKKWTKVLDAVRLEDQFERFGQEEVWAPAIQMRLLPPTQSNRTQIVRADEERMIQIQDTRFILNWKKGVGPYPTFAVLLPEFRELLQMFGTFSADEGLGALTFNQWEIIYVDQFRKGELWNSPRDWNKILSGFGVPVAPREHIDFGSELMSTDWRFNLVVNLGRMYISARQQRIPPSEQEVLNVTFTARGPVTPEQTWEQGFTVGHDSLNDTFIMISSEEAKASWQKGTR